MPGWWTALRQAEAFNYLVHNGGLSPHGAAGLVSRWAYVESTGGGPTAVNPYSGAFGIAQWLGSRKPPIAGNTNFQAQLAYVVRELNGTERRAGAVLRSARTSAEGARGASMYERAEGYNAATGIDNHVPRTLNNIPAILAIVGGGGAPPENIAGNTPIIPATGSGTGGIDDDISKMPISEATSMFSVPGLLFVAGGLALWYVLSD